MSFSFNDVKTWKIPQGTVTQVKVQNGDLLWDKIRYRYVSLGDSIAAGEAIRNEPIYWGDNKYSWQYGTPGVASTTIVDLCYTDLLRKDMVKVYGDGFVYAASFARSGDRVEDLMAKIGDPNAENPTPVAKALRRSHVVTICIGANNVLQPAFSHIDEYINAGSLNAAEAEIENNFAFLSDDSNGNSYKALFDRINALIKPGTRVVFTTVYNPYKYLHLDEGRNGFFRELVASIPEMPINVTDIVKAAMSGIVPDWILNAFPDYVYKLGPVIQEAILDTAPFQLIFSRINGLSSWAERYVTRLNDLIRTKINAYKATNSNFLVAESKALFDTYPDRGGGTTTYDQLVNVEFTRGFYLSQTDWGALWRDQYGTSEEGVKAFWLDLAVKHIKTQNAFPSTNVFDYVWYDMDGFANELGDLLIYKVFYPEMDVHPEEGGHAVLKEAFATALNNDYTKRGE